MKSLSELGVKAPSTSSSAITLAGLMLKEGVASEAVIFGPGDPLKAHRVDEAVYLGEVELARRALYGFLAGGLEC